MKAFICTIALWAVALAGYSQSFSVQMPKALQCSNVPTWPVSHSKKPNNLQLSSTAKNTATPGTTTTSKPATAVPAIPLIKLWLMTEGSKDDDN
ncbi:MAG: hypothetical protein EOO03_14540 [Chitinophagaceae bacterium]|nr:MAG: hypothetical protein EOO03_14540 [Chitinophagaceae bacterium]